MAFNPRRRILSALPIKGEYAYQLFDLDYTSYKNSSCSMYEVTKEIKAEFWWWNENCCYRELMFRR